MQQEQNQRTIRLIAEAPTVDPALKAQIQGVEGSLDIIVKLTEKDQVNIFIQQGEAIHALGALPFTEIAKDQTTASIDITIPEEVDIAKPFTIIGYNGLNQKYINVVEGKLQVTASPVESGTQNSVFPPIIFRLKDYKADAASLSSVGVKFEHIGALEVIHLTNNTAEKIEMVNASLSDASAYSVGKSWAHYGGYNSELGKSIYPYYDLLTGEIIWSTERPGYGNSDYITRPNIPAGETVQIYSWYIPNGNPIPEMTVNFVKPKTYENIKSRQLISPKSFPMRVGQAYHAYATWDGTDITLTDSKGTLKPMSVITVKTEIPVGDFIELQAYVSYGNRASSFVDLNGNGRKDGNLEDVPSGGYKNTLYRVAQSEISFYGKFESLILKKQKITSIDISPVAVPVELDLSDNLMDKDALNQLFEQLPDISHLQASPLVRKTLKIEGNPGLNQGGVNFQMAMDKGWILDILLVDETKPYLYLVMDNYGGSKKLTLSVDALPEDQEDIWIDLNGNAVMDEGEQITTFGKFFTIDWSKDEILLYGNVTKLDLSSNGNIFAFGGGTNTVLKQLNIASNGTVGVLLANQVNLEYLNISNNGFMVDLLPVELSHLTKLKYLDVSNSGLKKLDVRQMPDLISINASGNAIDVIDLSNKTKLRTVIASSTKIKKLDIAASKELRHLEITSTQLGGPALNAILEALPDRSSMSTPGGIWIANNPGTGEAKIKVAQDKKWDVDTKNLKAGNKSNRPDFSGEDW